MKKTTTSVVAAVILAAQLHSSEKLNEIIVTAKSQSDAMDTAGSYTVVTQEEIKEANANSVAEVLEQKAGISMGVNSGSQYGRSSMSIRGTESKHSLMLINGKRVSASDALIGMSDFGYNWLPLNAIEKIEVVKGPMSSLYGSSAIGGVVNMITKKPTEKFFGEFDAMYGVSSADGGDEQQYSLSLGGKITDALSATIYGQFMDIDPMKEGSSTIASREGKDIKNGMANLWYDIDNTQQLYISTMHGNEKRDNIKYREYYDIDRGHDSIGYKKSFESIAFDIKYYQTTLDAHSEDTSLLYTHKMQDNVINAEAKISALNNNYIVVGAEQRVEKYHKAYDLTPAKDFADEIDYTSLYLQDEISLGENTLLTLGGRYDKHERFGGELSPKAYLVYKLDPYNRVKGGYGHGFNAPSLTQNSDAYILKYPYKFTPPMKGYMFQGNSNLKPETSDSFELAYEYLKDELNIKSAIFYTQVDDLISYIDNGTVVEGPITYTKKLYSNVNKATIYGFELELEKRNLLSNLDMYAGYAYLHTEDEATGKELLMRPEHKANLKLESELFWGIRGVLRAEYIGEQFNGDKTLSPYGTLGAQLSKELLHGMRVYAGVDNLTDKQLSDDYDFQIKNRLIYARLNYKF